MPDPKNPTRPQPLYPEGPGMPMTDLPQLPQLPKPAELARAALVDSPFAAVLTDPRFLKNPVKAVANEALTRLPKAEFEATTEQLGLLPGGAFGGTIDPANRTVAVYAGFERKFEGEFLTIATKAFAINKFDGSGTEAATTLGVKGNGALDFLQGGLVASKGIAGVANENIFAATFRAGPVFFDYSNKDTYGVSLNRSFKLLELENGGIGAILDVGVRYGIDEPGTRPSTSFKLGLRAGQK